MWTAKDRLPPTPEHFDAHFLKAEGAHITLRPEVQQRLDEVLYIVGDPAGKRILDLGGGALLGRACERAAKYVLVDMSKEGCRIAKKVSPWANTICRDVLEWLEYNDDMQLHEQFDVTAAIGLVEYLPPEGLAKLFFYAPSPVLAFTTAVKEAYLKYEARVTVPSREDVAEVAERYGWKITKELPRPDHIWARYERN